MAEGKLIFREASAQAMEDAFIKGAANLREGIVEGMGADVRAEIAAWSSGTESRQAQDQKAGQLQERAELLVEAMDRAVAVIKEIQSLASQMEAGNVAILD
ncbi:MAG: hypothetical protein Q4D79_11865 [Propionibacteriaceae bacterium]|nr:hypothetical protein [Propionibacteriaceae bacterium]